MEEIKWWIPALVPLFVAGLAYFAVTRSQRIQWKKELYVEIFDYMADITGHYLERTTVGSNQLHDAEPTNFDKMNSTATLVVSKKLRGPVKKWNDARQECERNALEIDFLRQNGRHSEAPAIMKIMNSTAKTMDKELKTIVEIMRRELKK